MVLNRVVKSVGERAASKAVTKVLKMVVMMAA